MVKKAVITPLVHIPVDEISVDIINGRVDASIFDMEALKSVDLLR